MKKIIITHSALAAPLLFVFWLTAYPHTIRWMEEYSFFSALPDFLHLQVRLPADAVKYAGAFLLQFYRWPVAGALLQTLFAWIVLMCADAAAYRLLRRERLMWAAFIPTAAFVAMQCGYRDLERSLLWCLWAAAIAIVARIFARRPDDEAFRAPEAVAAKPVKKGRDVKKGERRSHAGAVNFLCRYGLPLAALATGMYVSFADDECLVRERIHRVEHLAEAKEWDRILEIVTPEASAEDPVRRRYALLALSETGQLADRMFEYGIESPDDFFFPHSADFIGIFFNSVFYENLGIDNEVVHLMYQLNQHSPFGFSFRTLRRIADVCLRQGDAVLAEKYLNILAGSTCNGGWVRSRMRRLDDLKSGAVRPEAFVAGDLCVGSQSEAPILMDMYNLSKAEPDNRKYVDLLLCGFLSAGLLDDFERMFAEFAPRFYADAERLPAHYEEALLLISLRNPELANGYKINPARAREFGRFSQLMNKGLRGAVKQNWPNTFWSYLYCE